MRSPRTRWSAAFVASLVLAGCSAPSPRAPIDSAAIAKHADDSIIARRIQTAPALVDSARRTMATLLKHPETALFDSLAVMQLPRENGAWSMPFVCGRIGGRPGIGGRSTLTPFIYRDRYTVFVLDKDNAAAFAALRAKDCNNPAARPLLR